MKPWPASVRFCLPSSLAARPSQIAVWGAGRLPARLSYVVDLDRVFGAPPRTAENHIIHHIRISTDNEINADVKSEGLFLEKTCI